MAFTADEDGEKYLCQCKQTKNAPFCDGTHRSLPAAAGAGGDDAAAAVVAARKPVAVKVEAGKEYYWCTCGRSASQPFCDGSHRTQNTPFKPLAWKAEEDGEKYFCQW